MKLKPSFKQHYEGHRLAQLICFVGIWMFICNAFVPEPTVRRIRPSNLPFVPQTNRFDKKYKNLVYSSNEDDQQTTITSPIMAWEYGKASNDWQLATKAPPLSAQQTYQWCRDFVVPLQLCPWAKASVETPTALQVFVVRPGDLPDHQDGVDSYQDWIQSSIVARFQEFLDRNKSVQLGLEAAAIFFVLFDHQRKSKNKNSTGEADSDWSSCRECDFDDFLDFYDWFVELEDEWIHDDVIVAPFHPDWSFDDGEGGDTSTLDLEKRSPYPTVTLVSARVVEAAGEAVTEQIGIHNAKILTESPKEELRSMWNQACTRNKGDDIREA